MKHNYISISLLDHNPPYWDPHWKNVDPELDSIKSGVDADPAKNSVTFL
jgi:hypothetical protein